MQKFLVLIFLLAPLPAIATDNDFPGVKGLMTPEEYAASGLDKLTDSEREALDQWLIRYTAWQAPALRQQSEQVREQERETGITAHVRQPFNGWSGGTRFYLDNGQVWEQRLQGHFAYVGDETTVTIRRNFMGFYVLEHVASGRKVGVKKVK